MNARHQPEVHKHRAGEIIYLFWLYLIFFLFGIGNAIYAQSTAPATQEISSTLPSQSITDNKAKFSDTLAPSLMLPLWQELMDRAAASYYKQSPEVAITLYQKALRIAAKSGDKRSAARTYYYLGRTYSGMGKINEAIIAYQASKAVFDLLGCQREGVYLLSDLGALYLNIEQYSKAQQCAEESLALAKLAQANNLPAGLWPDDYGIAGAYTLLAALERRAGKYEPALAHLKQAGELYQHLDRDGLQLSYQIADTCKETGQIYSDLGENSIAITWFRQALELATKLPHLNLVASILNSIGVLYLEQEDYDQAETYFQQALQRYQNSGNKTEAMCVLLNLGVTAQRRGKNSFALDHFQQALQQANNIGKQDVIIAAGEGLGVIYREQHNYSSAWQILQHSLSLARSLQDKVREAEILWRMAEVHQAQGNLTSALALALQARQFALQQRLPKLSYLTAVTIGQLYLGLKKLPEALEILRIAIKELENLRTHVAGKETERQLFFENKVAAYHLLLELFQQQGKSLDTLQAAEGAKARVLLDALQHGQSQLSRQLSLDCNAPTIQPAELNRVVGQKSAVLIYTVTPEQTFLFVLKHTATEPEIHLFTIPIKAQELRERAGSFHQLIAEQQPAFAADARALYRLLLEPAAPVLQGVADLCIIPDDRLWEVPFQALQSSSGSYVLEAYSVRYAPSLRVLTELNNQKSALTTPSLLAFGNPSLANHQELAFAPLPEAEKEVAAIGKLFRTSQVFTGAAATENRFKTMAARYSVLHLATHGVLNNRQPLESYLSLAKVDGLATEDGRLTAREIMQTKLNADLVVLSSCETAKGNIRAGEGVIGLSWAFFLAGCRTLVVSQWQVHSGSTAALMVNFFAQRQRQNQNALALRAAALQIMQQPRYQHPYYWASFITIGAP